MDAYSDEQIASKCGESILEAYAIRQRQVAWHMFLPFFDVIYALLVESTYTMTNAIYLVYTLFMMTLIVHLHVCFKCKLLSSPNKVPGLHHPLSKMWHCTLLVWTKPKKSKRLHSKDLHLITKKVWNLCHRRILLVVETKISSHQYSLLTYFLTTPLSQAVKSVLPLDVYLEKKLWCQWPSFDSS